MTTPIFAGLQLLLAKLESSYGEDITPVAADAIRARMFKATVKHEMVERPNKRATFSANDHALAGASVEFEVELDVKGPDAPTGEDPILACEADVFLQACQYVPTGTGTPVDKITYRPSSRAAQESLTLYWYEMAEGGTLQLHSAVGCRFTKKLIIPSNGVAYWSFSGRGLYVGAPTVVETLPTPVYKNARGHVPGRGCTVTYDDMSDVITKLEIDFGMTIEDRRSIGGDYGYAGFTVLGGQPRIKLDPEAVTEAGYALGAAILAGTLSAFALTVPTSDGGEWVFDVALAQVVDVKLSGEGILRHELDLAAVDNVGDDAISYYCQRTAVV